MAQARDRPRSCLVHPSCKATERPGGLAIAPCPRTLQDERYLERARAGGGRPANLTTAAALSRNEAVTDRAKFRVPRVLEMRARGARCFDFDFYTENNPDLAVLGTGKEDIWRHFVYNGQFEARRHRWGHGHPRALWARVRRRNDGGDRRERACSAGKLPALTQS